MTDYDAIHAALNRAAAALTEDILYLESLKADQNIIDALIADVACISRADDIVYSYQELEN